MVTDGFDSPVGTADERRSAQVLPGRWLDANPYGTFYNVTPTRQAYHTGADINLPEDRDAHAPVYAAAHGVVTYAKLGGGTWGKLIVLAHTLPSGEAVYSRYAHVETIGVRVGQAVKRGDEIGRIGNAEGQFPYHLHFDLSLTSTLGRNPEDWPGTDEARLKRDYVNPIQYIRRNRPVENPQPITPQEMIKAAQEILLQAASLMTQALAALTPAPSTADAPPVTTPTQARINSDIGLNARAAPTIKASIPGKIQHGEVITVLDDIQADGYQWCKILSGEFAGCYVAKPFLAFDVAVQDNPVALG
jgi:hypothetical protein